MFAAKKGVKNMLNELLKEYKLPEIPSKAECRKILQEHEYGYLPEKPEEFHYEVLETDKTFCAGLCHLTTVRLYGKLNGRDYSFPIKVVVSENAGEKRPLFVHLNFRSSLPDKYQPTEEIFNNGFALVTVCYTDVTSDDADYSTGLAKTIYPDGVKGTGASTAKIMMWAWAAMRALDYMEIAHQGDVDFDNVAIIGHSRLGKTALVTGAFDERFKYVFTNEAGCGGDSLERNHHDFDTTQKYRCAERTRDIYETFGFWFCENYAKYMDKPYDMPHDQHFFAGCIYPRFICVGSADRDWWADQTNQFMCAYAMGKFYEKNGKTGFICPDRLPQIGETFHEGRIGYHIRPGIHFLSRYDWGKYMAFVKNHMNDEL